MRARTRTNSDVGESLIELVLAVAIMGIAVVAIVGGIATSIVVADVHRKQAEAGAFVRNYAEAVESHVADGNYDVGVSPNYSSSTVGFTAPAGFGASVTSVLCWDDAGSQFTSCAAGSAVQQVSLNVASSDSRASESLTVIIRKP